MRAVQADYQTGAAIDSLKKELDDVAGGIRGLLLAKSFPR